MNFIKTTGVLSLSLFKRLMRDKIYLFFMIGLPVIFLLVFGTLYNRESVSSWNVAIENNTATPAGKELSKQILKYTLKTKSNKKGFFKEIKVKDRKAAEEKLARGEIDVIVTFPEDFGQISQTNKRPSGQIKILYRSASQSGSVAASVLDKFVTKLDTKLGRESANLTVKTVESNKRGLRQFDYLFAGMLAYTLMSFGLMGLSNALPEDKKTGALKRIHASPVSPAQYMFSYMLAFVGLAAIAFPIMFAIATYLFNWQMVGSWLNLIVFALLSLVMLFSLGLAVGGWAKDDKQASGLSNLVMFPLMFLSGIFFPRFMMPEFIQKLTDYIPLTPVNDGIRLIITEDYSLVQVLPQIGLIALFALIIYAIAIKVFRWG